MGQQKNWYLISYDIRDPKRLSQTARHLEGYGARVQYSLFRCRLTVRQLERLQWELTPILAPEDDLLIIGLRKPGAEEGKRGRVGDGDRDLRGCVICPIKYR